MLLLDITPTKSLYNVNNREQRRGQKARLLRERPWEPDLVALERLDLSQSVEPALTVWWSYNARRTAFLHDRGKVFQIILVFHFPVFLSQFANIVTC